MSVRTSYQKEDKKLTLMIEQRLDFSVFKPFRDAYESRKETVAFYEVDLQHADYLESSALGMLIALHDYADGEAAQVHLINCKPAVKQILIVAKLDVLFKIN